MTDEIRFVAASGTDRAAIVELLEGGDLPSADIDADLLRGFVLARRGDTVSGELVGVCGIEVRGSVGLLRSLAVAPGRRGQSLGRALLEDRVAWAVRAGLEALFLLTLDADGYFARFGFERVGRDDLPAAIRATREFRSLCPASAVAMRRSLSTPAV